MPAERPSDFRSDTVTRPTEEMRAAMAAAEVGDDVLDGDPTVRRLEERAAEWLGKAGAIFVPSGTMANQVAAGAWGAPGVEFVLSDDAHMVLYEGGALGYLHGVQTATVPAPRGRMDLDRVRASIRADFDHHPRTAAVCVEQTHMSSGGRVVPLEHLRAIAAIARERGVPVHMDGARLANAAVAAGIEASAFAATADSVSVCLSKGLGAPVGSVVAGHGEFLARARRIRHLLGGWMRQAGVIAAAGLLALERGIERLAEDHDLARSLAARLHELPGLACDPAEVETNLAFVAVDHPRHDAASLARALGEAGVLVFPFDAKRLRFVTHRDVGPRDVERLAEAAATILGRERAAQ